MNRFIADSVKTLFSSLGFSLARQREGEVNGYDLHHDLKAIMPEPNPLCFDIGANEGQTIRLLKSCFSNPKIHSFEPSSTTFSNLSSQSFGPNVTIHELAVGERVGQAEFRNYKQSVLSSFLPMHSDKKENFFAEEELVSIETVRVETVDNFCSIHNITSIDLLKIDTQGYELPVLGGGIKMFTEKKIATVLLELNFSTLYDGQSDPLEIFSFLHSHGFRLVDFYEKDRKMGNALSWTTALFTRNS